MNDASRVPFVKMAEGDKARYEKEKKEYEKTTSVSKAKPTPKSTPTGKKAAAKKEESEEENADDDN